MNFKNHAISLKKGCGSYNIEWDTLKYPYTKSKNVFCGNLGFKCEDCQSKIKEAIKLGEDFLKFLEKIIKYQDENGIQDELYKMINNKITDIKQGLEVLK